MVVSRNYGMFICVSTNLTLVYSLSFACNTNRLRILYGVYFSFLNFDFCYLVITIIMHTYFVVQGNISRSVQVHYTALYC